MPADIKKIIQNKDLIISTIQNRGPCLPVHIARAANMNLLFASAYLSELYGEKKIKMSYMRVGSSPLYYIEGQEPQLEKFSEHLNAKEQEALNILKNEKILNDEKLPPPIRVAIRELRDFANHLNVKIKKENKIFWKYFLLSDEDAKKMLLAQLAEKPEEEKEEKLKEEKTTKPAKTIQRKTKQKKEDSGFINKIKEFVEKKEYEFIETIITKKKEISMKIKINTPIGKQEYLIIAKEKKKINSDDIKLALHLAQLEKMPALLVSSGSPDKEAQDQLNTWRNLIKFEKINL